MTAQAIQIVRGSSLPVKFPGADVKGWGWVSFSELAEHFQMTIEKMATYAGPLSSNFSDKDCIEFCFIDGNNTFHQPHESMEWVEGIAYIPAGLAIAVQKARMAGVAQWEIQEVTGYIVERRMDDEDNSLDTNVWNVSYPAPVGCLVIKGRNAEGNYVDDPEA